MSFNHAQKPLLLKNAIPLPHRPDTYPTPTPTPMPPSQPEIPASSPLLDRVSDIVYSYQEWLPLFLIAMALLLVLYVMLRSLLRYAEVNIARRELKRALAERREKYLVYGEDHGEGED